VIQVIGGLRAPLYAQEMVDYSERSVGHRRL